MTKSKAKRRQRPSADFPNVPAKKLKTQQTPDGGRGGLHEAVLTSSHEEPELVLQAIIPDGDLDITVETLRMLADHPALIKTKACRDLRAAVFDFKQACTTGAIAAVDANLTSRISGAIADQDFVGARILLAEMRIRRQKPKLGALCRWVRDLDVVSGLAEQRNGKVERTAAQRDVLLVLDAVMRVVGPVDYSIAAGEEADDHPGRPMVVRQALDLRDGRTRRRVYDSVLDGSLTARVTEATTAMFRIVETTPGPERKPPNRHPAILHASRDHAIQLSSPPPATTHHRHPVVPNLHLLKDVLTPDECEQIIGVAEKIGFTPDAPIRADAEGASVLAHNFYWIADEAFCAGVWGRVSPFVPPSLAGRRVRGLNRRFRVYRYVPGAEYRAHIDGAWPPSGIVQDREEEGGGDKYVYDASPDGARQSSLFTFLIYLNDEFEAGETTYFLPGLREGTLNAYSLKPIQGSVALFPHGEVEGNLLHEGTGVMREERPSAKYVIRTDVEYDVDPLST
ncbi:hypothetical protein HK405_011722 [Cladochytrium tenue]|nr:hypothetical protein HK405_011722 [Cladochytrium tenue]